jgi:SAM-dependent methyltransferase
MEKIILKIDDREYDFSRMDLSRLYPEHTNYQTKEFVDEKWKRLNIDVKDKTVLDIGCNSGGIGAKCLENECKEYNGFDNNWRYLEDCVSKGINFNCLHLGDINDVTIGVGSYDIVLLLATFHYVKPELRDSFIKHLSNITNEMLVLEGPVENGEIGFAPKREEIEMLLNKYFKRVEFCGESIPHSKNIIPERAKRFIWKAYQK